MRGLLVSLTVLVVVAPGLVAGLAAAGGDDSLIVNEVMPNPVGSDSKYEWIELYNEGTAEVELSQWQLDTATLPNYQLQAQEYVLLARNASALSERFPEASILESNFSLPNSGGKVTTSSAMGSSSFSYPEASEGISFELLSGDCNTVAAHPDSSSAGSANTSCESESPPESPESLIRVFISRVEPAPETGAEWLELTNLSDSGIILDGLIITDASGKKHSLTGLSIEGMAILKIYPKPVSLNNDGDTITLMDSSGKQMDVYRYPAAQTEQSASKPGGSKAVTVKQTACPVVETLTVELDQPRLFRLDQ